MAKPGLLNVLLHVRHRNYEAYVFTSPSGGTALVARGHVCVDGCLLCAAREPSADQAADAQQAGLVQLVGDLQKARRRTDSTEEQVRFLQERYWIVPKGTA